jgi:hypothetical protein
MRRFKLTIIVAGALAVCAITQGASAKSLLYKGYLKDACGAATLKAEREHDLPVRLLGAISLAESAKWDENRQAEIAWPWTVYAEGKGRRFQSKAKAVAAVRALRARGVQNIDVGCMQVNLKYHPDAFTDLSQAFDPVTNTRFAAGFLKKLQAQHRSWALAAAHYHSATKSLNRPYRRKVLDLWHEERRRWFEYLRMTATKRREANRQQRMLPPRESGDKVASND